MLIRSPKELALHLVNRRKKLKLSQTETGQRVGLKQQTVSDFEVKPNHTQLETLFRILSALNLDIRISSKDETISSSTKWDKEW